MRNLELKARVDDLMRLRNIATKLGAAFGGKDRQIDTFYKVPEGRFKIRESSITGNELIAYSRRDKGGAMESEYERVRLYDVTRFKRLLGRALDFEAVVVKQREIFILGNARIHLDEVENLGSFIEFELELDNEETGNHSAESIIKELTRLFDIKEENIVGRSYADLLKAGAGG